MSEKANFQPGSVVDFLMPFGQGMIASVQLWGRDIKKGWYACEYPERPTDAWVMWHYDEPCRACNISAQALLMRYPDDTHVQWLNRRLANA